MARDADVIASVRAHARDEYVIAIPSYRRAEQIEHRTLATLDRLHVDRSRITVFVADTAELDLYRAALGDDWCVVVGRPGLVACRQWYSNVHYPAGTPILHLDDDIDELLMRTPDDKLAPWDGTVDRLCAMGFGMARAVEAGLWGVSGYTNGFYMHDHAVAGLRYICGIAFGSFAGDQAVTPDGPPDPDSGEDFLRTLRAYSAHGAVVRLDWIGPKTVYFGPGGMLATFDSNDDRSRVHASALRRIALRYPKLAKCYPKADGNTNLRLRDVTVLRVPRAELECA